MDSADRIHRKPVVSGPKLWAAFLVVALCATCVLAQPPRTAACCYPDGTCADGVSETDCAANDGPYQGDGSLCIFSDCQLHPFRTAAGKQDPKKRSRAIRSFCIWCIAGNAGDVKKCVSPDCPLYPFRNARIDRSTEINSSPEREHIEALCEGKTRPAYVSVGDWGESRKMAQ